MEKQKEQLQPQLTCFHIPDIISFFMIHPACPWETLEQPQGTTECIHVFFFISTLLMQFASHKGPAPPAAKGLYLKHKYNIMGVNSLLLAYKPNPEVFWGPWDLAMEVGFRLRVQDSQLNGCRFASWLHHLLVVGPWLSPQSPGFLIWKATVSKVKWDLGSAWCTGPVTTQLMLSSARSVGLRCHHPSSPAVPHPPRHWSAATQLFSWCLNMSKTRRSTASVCSLLPTGTLYAVAWS